MIATVTLNPALDKTLLVPDFDAGKTNRGQVERLDPGGKGTNVAKALRQLGCPVVALGFAAGLNGQFLRRALDGLGIPHDFIDVPGETRVNLKIEDPRRGIETELNEPGFPVTAAHLAEMERRVDDYARRAQVMVFAGSLPPGAPSGTYAGLIRIAAQRGVKTILRTPEVAWGRVWRAGKCHEPSLVAHASACRVHTRVDPGLDTSVEAAGTSARATKWLSAYCSTSGVRILDASGAATAASGGSSVAARAAIEALLAQVEVTELEEAIAR